MLTVRWMYCLVLAVVSCAVITHVHGSSSGSNSGTVDIATLVRNELDNAGGRVVADLRQALLGELTSSVGSVNGPVNEDELLAKKVRALGMSQTINLKTGTLKDQFKHNFAKASLKDSGYLPVIQMHGMGDFANDPFGMVPLAKSISEELNGTYVLNVQIGENSLADILNGFLMNLDDQVDYFANVIRNDPHFVNGFNAVGYSQGNLVIRGYIERYNNPPIRNFISMHGPLAGVAAFPGCSLDKSLCRAFSEVLGALAYHPNVQQHLTQANYFRDPYKLEKYRTGAIFLPDVNNEDSTNNPVYASNFASLQSLCLVKALGDTVVIPNESEWFGFYQDKSFDNIWTFDQTPWYSGDAFGLKTMNAAGTIHFETTDENHLDFSTDYLLSLVDTYFK